MTKNTSSADSMKGFLILASKGPQRTMGQERTHANMQLDSMWQKEKRKRNWKVLESKEGDGGTNQQNGNENENQPWACPFNHSKFQPYPSMGSQ